MINFVTFALINFIMYQNNLVSIYTKTILFILFYLFLKKSNYQTLKTIFYYLILIMSLIIIINPFYEIYPSHSSGSHRFFYFGRQSLGFQSAISLSIFLLIGLTIEKKILSHRIEQIIIITAIIFTQSTIAMLGILLLLFRKYYLLVLIFILISTIGLFLLIMEVLLYVLTILYRLLIILICHIMDLDP